MENNETQGLPEWPVNLWREGKAYFPDKRIAVLSDACAGAAPENHQKALDAMKCLQTDVL